MGFAMSVAISIANIAEITIETTEVVTRSILDLLAVTSALLLVLSAMVVAISRNAVTCVLVSFTSAPVLPSISRHCS